MEGENEFGFEPGRDRLAERAFAFGGKTPPPMDNADGVDGGERKSSSMADAAEANGNGSKPNETQVQQQAMRQAELDSQSIKSSQSQNSNRMEEETNSLPAEQLPQTFQVKYLGEIEAGGLWGIKHTRRPVDLLVRSAKELRSGQVLPLARLTITRDNVTLQPIDSKGGKSISFPISDISYGVQDLVYTRVFSMIVVKETTVRAGQVPFRCHGFVCESRSHARKVTYTLATAFRLYSKELQTKGASSGEKRKKFAIDIRSPEEIEAQLVAELDSEA